MCFHSKCHKTSFWEPLRHPRLRVKSLWFIFYILCILYFLKMLNNRIGSYYFVIHVRFEQVNTDTNQIWVAEADTGECLGCKKEQFKFANFCYTSSHYKFEFIYWKKNNQSHTLVFWRVFTHNTSDAEWEVIFPFLAPNIMMSFPKPLLQLSDINLVSNSWFSSDTNYPKLMQTPLFKG